MTYAEAFFYSSLMFSIAIIASSVLTRKSIEEKIEIDERIIKLEARITNALEQISQLDSDFMQLIKEIKLYKFPAPPKGGK